MKAAVVTQWGRDWSIEVRDLPKPMPAANELLVKVRAATVNRTDCGELRHPWLERLIIGRRTEPRTVLGMDFAGEVEAVGNEVSTFKPGDRVFGMCRRTASGAQAEYFCMPETGPVGILPNGTPFEEAPVCEGAYYANASVSRYCKPGTNALIYGASGAIGVAALQLAKYYGADVTAVVAGRHVEVARSLGADFVVDYATPEFRQLGREFDFVLDAVGKMTVSQWRRLVRDDGHFAVTDLGPWGLEIPFLLWSALTGNGKASVPLPKRGSAQEFVQFLGERIAAGQFRAVVDRTYPLAEIADAYRYVQTGEKQGIVVVEV